MTIQKTWECFFHCYTDIRISFIIRHHRIIFGTIFFNQITLKHQCFHLGICYNVFKVSNLRNHLRNLRRTTMPMSCLKILPYPAVQTDRFANIKNFITLTVHDINTRTFRKLLQFFLHVKHILTLLGIMTGTIYIHIDSLSFFCHTMIDSYSVKISRIKLGGIHKIPPAL